MRVASGTRRTHGDDERLVECRGEALCLGVEVAPDLPRERRLVCGRKVGELSRQRTADPVVVAR